MAQRAEGAAYQTRSSFAEKRRQENRNQHRTYHAGGQIVSPPVVGLGWAVHHSQVETRVKLALHVREWKPDAARHVQH